ncbi:MAG: AtuA-related protein, partial [Methyloligellaceae bacterium]
MSLIEVPLHAVAHGRAGDKGNRSNISVIPYR